MDVNLPDFSNDAVIEIIGRFRDVQGVLDDRQEHVHNIDEIMEVLEDLEESGFVVPFDWQAWSEDLGTGWNTDEGLLDEADLDTLRCLTIAHLRIERFNFGHLDGIFRSGYMARLFDRLEAVLTSG